MSKFLDLSGLSYFVSKLNERFGGIDNKISDRYTKAEVNNLIKDPTYNTTTSCVGYGEDILGGY